MKNIVTRLQKDLNKLQDTLQKEGNNLLTKLKKTDFIDTFEARKKHLEKVVETQFKKFEPVFQNFLDQLNKNAQKAGIDLTKMEKEILKKAKNYEATWKEKAKKAKSKLETVTKKKAKKTKAAATKKTAAPKKAKAQKKTKRETTAKTTEA